jgi:enolase
MRTLKEMTVNSGDSIRFDIGFSGGSKENLEFRHEGRRLVEGAGGVRIQVEKDVASLIIEAAAADHSGLYECIMRTDGGEARCQVRCLVVGGGSATAGPAAPAAAAEVNGTDGPETAAAVASA